MIEDLRKILIDVRRLPESRQRDAAACIGNVAEWDDHTFSQLDSARQRQEESPPIESPPSYWERVPAEDIAKKLPRNPFLENAPTTRELSDVIGVIENAPENRQRYAAYILGQLVECDRWDIVLTPKQQRELEQALSEIKSER